VSATASSVEEDERLTFSVPESEKVREREREKERNKDQKWGGFSWAKNLSDKVDGGTCVTIGEKAKFGIALGYVDVTDELKEKINFIIIQIDAN
jgi:hypothetical protein